VRKLLIFSEWFLFDFILEDGKTPLAHFADENPLKLPENELAIYRSMQENEYGVFEVKEVRYGKGMTLQNMQTGKVYDVDEVSGTWQITRGNVLFVRVINVGDDTHEIAGGSTVYIPARVREVEGMMPQEVKSGREKITPQIVFALVNGDFKKGYGISDDQPSILDLDITHAGIEIKKHASGYIEIIGSYEGPTEESYDSCPVCVVIKKAHKEGKKMPDPETLRVAIEKMAYKQHEKQKDLE